MQFFRKNKKENVVYVHQGDLYDMGLKEILGQRNLGRILVTGSMKLAQAYTYIPVPVTVMKDCYAKHICLESNFTVAGACKAEMITAVNGNVLSLGPGSQIGKLTGEVSLTVN